MAGLGYAVYLVSTFGQAHRVQAGGGSVHVWGAFHNSAKSPLVLPDGYLTGVLYRRILQNT